MVMVPPSGGVSRANGWPAGTVSPASTSTAATFNPGRSGRTIVSAFGIRIPDTSTVASKQCLAALITVTAAPLGTACSSTAKHGEVTKQNPPIRSTANFQWLGEMRFIAVPDRVSEPSISDAGCASQGAVMKCCVPALNARFASMPDASYEDVVCSGYRDVSNNVGGGAEADYDLADVCISGPHPQSRKFLQSLDCRPDASQRTLCCLVILMAEKTMQALDVHHGVGRKSDHPILRGCGRGNSSAEPQLATQALTSSRGTASPVRLNSSKRRRSSATSGPERSTTESSSATASASTAATSCPRSVAISRSRASVSASISSVRLTRFIVQM